LAAFLGHSGEGYDLGETPSKAAAKYPESLMKYDSSETGLTGPRRRVAHSKETMNMTTIKTLSGETLTVGILRPVLPTVGMPCTYGIGSDTYAGKVLAVSKSGHRVTVNIGDGDVRVFTRRTRHGLVTGYVPAGRPCGYLTLGVARDYRDPSF
jgi:hypothetical protein